MTAAKHAHSDELTAPVEDYLKAIYEIERTAASTGSPGHGEKAAGAGAGGGGRAAATTDIAHRLAIAPASVSGMLRRLAEQGLIRHERYRGVRLTDTGRRAALRTIRRHRVIEAYLVQALGYSWDRVHEEAEQLEHSASDELIDRMATAIGEPAVDPHGAPIPTREGAVDERPLLRLAELAAGTQAKVVRVSDDDAALLRYLAELDIVPGAAFEVVAHAPFAGPVTIRTAGGERVLGRALSERVLVEEKVLDSPGDALGDGS
ncbi:MAG: metal-dependent transcriptional regulator [Gemmatimonadaceae bacterium]